MAKMTSPPPSSLPLRLSQQVSFEPVGKVTHVFFDDLNQQVFSVRSGGATGTMARGFSPAHNSTFRLDDRGRVATIKLSPDQATLAVHRPTRAEVELLAVERPSGRASAAGGGVSPGALSTVARGAQACRTKGASLLGFSWMGEGGEVAFVTDKGVELYAVSPSGEGLRTVRSHSQDISWYCLCPRSQVMVTAAAPSVKALHVFLLRGGYVYKLHKLEFDGHELNDRDVAIVQLYGRTYVAVILHGKRATGNTSGDELHLFALSFKGGSGGSPSVSKTFVLKVPGESSGGGLALNCVDDVLMVHSQPLFKTFFFDLCSTGDSDGTVTYLLPAATGVFENPSDSSSTTSSSSDSTSLPPSPYASGWVTFQPDVVVDAKQGLMWKVRLSVASAEKLLEAIPDPARLVSFLKRREGAKGIMLQVLLRLCSDTSIHVRTIGGLLDQLNAEYRLHVNARMQQQMALPTSTSFSSARQAIRQTLSPTSPSAPSPTGGSEVQQDKNRRTSAQTTKVVIDQADLFASLFSPMLEVNNLPRKRLEAILMEYFRSLEEHKLSPQYFLCELVINLLVTSRQWFQLHVLLQYRVIPDSKPLACLLLSLESAYEPALQLAMDMLHRLRNSADEICEVLLSKGLVVNAVKYAAANNLDHLPVRKFLEAASQNEDKSVFFNVFQSFEVKNVIPKSCYQEFLDLYQIKTTAAANEPN